jgi:hypothetical protein
MDEMIFYQSNKISSKGKNINNKIDKNKLKSYFFKKEYDKLVLLDNVSTPTLTPTLPILFYPGCGADMFSPLLYLDKLFPEIKQAKLIFVDNEDCLSLLKTVLDDVGITFSGRRKKIKFYWNNKLITLIFVKDFVQNILDKYNYDIYFERAFRIMKDNLDNYETNVVKQLNPGGILISDSGFQDQNLQLIEVPKNLSAYNEMIIGIKK